ncbi:MAG: hypothetical protein ACREQY_01090, partial [Candidatus Binatia bacterium]
MPNDFPLLDGRRAVGEASRTPRGTLSPEGLRKVETIMSLEREVARLERESWTCWPLQFSRDPKRYHVSLFGEPVVAPPHRPSLDQQGGCVEGAGSRIPRNSGRRAGLGSLRRRTE